VHVRIARIMIAVMVTTLTFILVFTLIGSPSFLKSQHKYMVTIPFYRL
jgi:hypothetical protein